MLQGSRRRYRRLFAEGEGASVTNSGGCFPDFYDLQDFRDWLDGSYQSARAQLVHHTHPHLKLTPRPAYQGSSSVQSIHCKHSVLLGCTAAQQTDLYWEA
jgi:hypothetical protein